MLTVQWAHQNKDITFMAVSPGVSAIHHLALTLVYSILLQYNG